ncbi:MAG TPA: orotate phosphoribosyltransferase [Acidimicrobiia bacterium]
MSRQALLLHLVEHALRTDGPFTLRSGQVSSWYLDARQTTFDGQGAALVGETVLELIDTDAVAVGGMTMGADPIAVATAIAAARVGRPLRAFSVRREAKDHGTGGRVVGPIEAGDRVTVVEDTTTTGSAAMEAIEALRAEGIEVIQVVALVDRSGGTAGSRFAEAGVPFTSVFGVADLGVEE